MGGFYPNVVGFNFIDLVAAAGVLSWAWMLATWLVDY